MAETMSPTDSVEAVLKFNVEGQPLEFRGRVPKGDVTLRELLPILRDFTHATIDVGVRAVVEKGKSISCKAGCGACCCQLVPINRSETFVIRDVVESMPAERKAEVLRRFTDARSRLQAQGMYDALFSGNLGQGETLKEYALRYFHLGISCPFLENQSCSIYDDRPLKCREYLVTSPAEDCAHPESGKVEGVPIMGRPANAAMRVGSSENGQSWVPLIVALDWAMQHAEDPKRPGPKLFEEFLERFFGGPKAGTSSEVETPI